MKQLWTEAYRPKNLDEYVFRDEKQKIQVKQWIKSGAIPHLIFSGAAGTGKCLGGNELIDIQIDTSTLSEEQIMMLGQYKL